MWRLGGGGARARGVYSAGWAEFCTVFFCSLCAAAFHARPPPFRQAAAGFGGVAGGAFGGDRFQRLVVDLADRQGYPSPA